jgi:MFS family permease
MYLGIVNTGYSSSFFTPTILNQLGPTWTPVRSQVMSIPIYIVATFLALVTAFLTDRLKHRFTFIIIGCCVATAGYAILLSMTHVSVGARYAALFLITGGGKSARTLPRALQLLLTNRRRIHRSACDDCMAQQQHGWARQARRI